MKIEHRCPVCNHVTVLESAEPGELSACARCRLKFIVPDGNSEGPPDESDVVDPFGGVVPGFSQKGLFGENKDTPRRKSTSFMDDDDEEESTRSMFDNIDSMPVKPLFGAMAGDDSRDPEDDPSEADQDHKFGEFQSANPFASPVPENQQKHDGELPRGLTRRIRVADLQEPERVTPPAPGEQAANPFAKPVPGNTNRATQPFSQRRVGNTGSGTRPQPKAPPRPTPPAASNPFAQPVPERSGSTHGSGARQHPWASASSTGAAPGAAQAQYPNQNNNYSQQASGYAGPPAGYQNRQFGHPGQMPPGQMPPSGLGVPTPMHPLSTHPMPHQPRSHQAGSHQAGSHQAGSHQARSYHPGSHQPMPSHQPPQSYQPVIEARPTAPVRRKYMLSIVEGLQPQSYTFQQGASYVIGRDHVAGIKILSKSVSRKHAMIETTGPTPVLIDLGSANGTVVNGQRISRLTLSEGDLIKFGEVVLRFQTIPA